MYLSRDTHTMPAASEAIRLLVNTAVKAAARAAASSAGPWSKTAGTTMAMRIEEGTWSRKDLNQGEGFILLMRKSPPARVK